MSDIKDIWKLYVILSGLNHSEVKSFNDWVEDLRGTPVDDSAENAEEILAKFRRDMGR